MSLSWNVLIQMQQIFVFSYDYCCLFVNGIIFFFTKLIIFFIRCSLKDWQNFFMKSSPLYTSCLFSIPSTAHIVGIGYLQRNMFTYFCCAWFFKIVFTSIFFLNQIFKIWLNSRSWLNHNILVSLEGITTPQKPLFQVCFLF